MKTQNKENIIERFSPSITNGLTNEQVLSRVNNKLTNQAEKQYSKSYLNIVFSNVFTFFNLLGLIVTIALLLTGAETSQFFFDVIFLANILIGIIQETRAKITIDKLSLMSGQIAKVIRNGELFEIPLKEIVLDDILQISIGNQVPTDSIILEGSVEVNESLLTGESIAVKKSVGDMIFAGSFIISGTVKAKAEKVGKDNYIERLSAKAKKYKKPYSEIMFSLKKIIKLVSCVIVPFAILFIIKGLIYNNDINNTILKTSSVVIGMIPSGMFLLTTMALAVGVIKLSRHNTLVQDLYSLEMLARVDTICFDKTGTITDGNMNVKEVVNISNSNIFNIDKIMSSMLDSLRDTNQTATALFNKFGYSKDYEAEKILPFNSSRKLSAVTFKDIGTFSFGAPEFVLSKEKYNELKNKIDSYASMGLRVIILAYSQSKIENEQPPKDFSPLSLILLNDNIRTDAIETVKWFKDNDVTIKVISGDNPVTVSEVSKRVGIENADKIISLEGLTDEEVFDSANKYTVFGRVSPDQKAILIKAMKLAGHVTAMTGDGVNDILAMKEADCAITVASGSDAARNVANLVLTDNNFNSMPQIVHEGRRVINNVQSSASLYLMKTLFTMILSFIILCIPSLTVYPFELNQMILIEVFIIGLPSFFLSLQPNEMRVKGKFISFVLSRSLPSAILMVASVGLSKIGDLFIINNELLTTIQVFSFTFAGAISLMYICKPFNKYRTVLFSTTIFVVFAICAYSFIFGLSLFGFEKFIPISENYLGVILLIANMIILIPLYSAIKTICSYLGKIIVRNNKKYETNTCK